MLIFIVVDNLKQYLYYNVNREQFIIKGSVSSLAKDFDILDKCTIFAP